MQVLFRDRFLFSTQIYEIPAGRSAASLQLTLATLLLQSDDPGNMVILYYVGNCYVGEPNLHREKSSKCFFQVFAVGVVS
jgi:hypothetical protein